MLCDRDIIFERFVERLQTSLVPTVNESATPGTSRQSSSTAGVSLLSGVSQGTRRQKSAASGTRPKDSANKDRTTNSTQGNSKRRHGEQGTSQLGGVLDSGTSLLDASPWVLSSSSTRQPPLDDTFDVVPATSVAGSRVIPVQEMPDMDVNVIDVGTWMQQGPPEKVPTSDDRNRLDVSTLLRCNEGHTPGNSQSGLESVSDTAGCHAQRKTGSGSTAHPREPFLRRTLRRKRTIAQESEITHSKDLDDCFELWDTVENPTSTSPKCLRRKRQKSSQQADGSSKLIVFNFKGNSTVSSSEHLNSEDEGALPEYLTWKTESDLVNSSRLENSGLTSEPDGNIEETETVKPGKRCKDDASCAGLDETEDPAVPFSTFTSRPVTPPINTSTPQKKEAPMTCSAGRPGTSRHLDPIKTVHCEEDSSDA